MTEYCVIPKEVLSEILTIAASGNMSSPLKSISRYSFQRAEKAINYTLDGFMVIPENWFSPGSFLIVDKKDEDIMHFGATYHEKIKKFLRMLPKHPAMEERDE